MASSNEITQIKQIKTEMDSLNNTIQKVNSSYLTVVKSIESGNKRIKDAGLSYENLNKAQKQTQKTSQELDRIGKQLAASEQKLKDLQDQRTEVILRNRKATRDSTQSINQKIRAQQAEKGSIEQLSAVNSILEKRLKAVNLTTEEGRKRAERLRSAIDRNNKVIKDNSSALGAQRINIGNYGSALEGLSPAFGRASMAANRLGAAFKLLLANPVVLVISAIVAAFAGLVAIFRSTDDGGTKLQGVFTGIKNVLGVLKNALVQVLGGLNDLVHLRFRDGLTKIGDAFGYVAENTVKAYNAGYNYEQQLDSLNDRITSNISAQAETLRQFREYINLSKDQTAADEDKLAALNKASEAASAYYGQIAKDEKERFDLDVANAASRTKLTADQLEQFIALDGKRAEEARKNNQDIANAWNVLGDDVIKSLEDQYSKSIEAETEFFKRTNEITSLRTGIIKSAQAEQLKAVQESEKAKGQAVLDMLATQEEAIKATTEVEKDEIDELLEFYEEEFEAEVEAYLDKEQKKREAAKKTADDEIEIAKQTQDILFEVGSEGVNALFDLKSAKRQQELDLIQSNLEQGVISEEEAARQTAEVKQKQARADKLQSLFNIGISTAEAILKVTAQTGVLAPFVIPGIIALGAIQAALVAATPIPEFAKGTNNSPDKFIAGEKGRELMTLKSGETMIVDSPTYFKGSQFKGAKIKSNAETERIIKSQDRERTSSLSFNDARIINELSGLRKDIKKKPVMIVDKNSNQIGYLYGRNKNRYLNKLING